MKILHTSDWHIGKTLGSLNFLSYQEEFLNYLLDYIEKEKIDYLIVAGDVFHNKIPDVLSLKLINDFFYKLSLTKCKASLFLLGNHDQSGIFTIYKNLLSRLNIYISDSFSIENSKVGDFFYFPNKKNPELIIASISYFNVFGIKDLDFKSFELTYENKNDEMEAKKKSHALKNEEFSSFYFEIFNKMKSELKNEPALKIFMSHFWVTNKMDAPEGEYFLDASSFEGFFDYHAFGHIHNYMKVDENMYFSGSPIQYDFSETENKKFIVIEVEDNLIRKIKPIKIPNTLKMLTIKGVFEVIKNEINSLNSNEYDIFLSILHTEVLTSEQIDFLHELSKNQNLQILSIKDSRENTVDHLSNFKSNISFKNNELSDLEKQDEKYFFKEKLKEDLKKKSFKNLDFKDVSDFFEDYLKNSGISNENK